MSKINVSAINKETKRIVDRIGAMIEQGCVGGCGKQPHQQIGDDLVCWRCGSY